MIEVELVKPTGETPMNHAWVNGFPAAITVCDTDGTILEMNPRAIESFADEGGESLIGSSLLDCHPEPARSILAGLLQRGQQNVYTIEKGGKKKLIYQSPWYVNGEFKGLVELSLPLPEVLPHFVRDKRTG
jgi:PAS domain-containing protein